MAETFAKCFDRGRLEITPEAAAMLGKTIDEISPMTLEKFATLVFDSGCGIKVTAMSAKGESGKLTITAASEHERRRAEGGGDDDHLAK